NTACMLGMLFADRAVHGPFDSQARRLRRVVREHKNIIVLAPFSGLHALASSVGICSMAHNYYSEIKPPLTWHTKLSRPLLTPQIEPMAWAALREKAVELGGIAIHEIGGTETHVHLALSIEPPVTISELVGALKGYAAHEVNRRAGLKQKVL